MSRILLLALALASTSGMAPAAAMAQAEDARLEVPEDARRYLDYYMSRFRLAWSSGNAEETDAVGGRLMWSMAPLVPSWNTPWLDRALLGGYVAHTSEDVDRMEILRFGAQMDFIVTPEPLAGRIEPLVSLAAGAVRVTEPGIQWRSVPYIVPDGQGERGIGAAPPLMLEASLPERTHTRPSLTPGIGARIRLLPGLSLRTDARRVIDFRDGATGNLELSGGISVGTE